MRIPLRPLVLVLVACAFAATATAQQQVDLFRVTSAMSCSLLEDNISTLQDANGATSLLLVDRANGYQGLQQQLQAVKNVPIPYQDEDLSKLPREEYAGLQSTTRRVPHQVSAPIWTLTFSGLLLGVAGGVGTYNALNDPYATQEQVVSLVGITALGAVGVVVGLSNTATVYETVTNEQAVRANNAIRTRVNARNAQIDRENATRAQKAAERQDAIDRNAEAQRRRAAIQAQMEEYEVKSRRLAEGRLQELQLAADRRCLAHLEAVGAAVHLQQGAADVYLLVRPLNPSGDPLPNAHTVSGLDFRVRQLRLSDPLGAVASVRDPAVRAFEPAYKTPAAMPDGEGGVYALELQVDLQQPVADTSALAVTADVEATQEGVAYDATVQQGAARVLP